MGPAHISRVTSLKSWGETGQSYTGEALRISSQPVRNFKAKMHHQRIFKKLCCTVNLIPLIKFWCMESNENLQSKYTHENKTIFNKKVFYI